jgi:hypothetical protein
VIFIATDSEMLVKIDEDSVTIYYSTKTPQTTVFQTVVGQIMEHKHGYVYTDLVTKVIGDWLFGEDGV